MMDDSSPTATYSRGERIAAGAGIVLALLLLFVSVDVASGGLLSRRRVTGYAWQQATEQDGAEP